MRAISLGWGLQSWGLAAMSALGELPPVDVAIHADTTHERSDTYTFAAKWTPWLEERGVKVVTVKPTRCTGPVTEWGGIFIPAYTLRDGSKGMLRRQCTYDWKIAPIRRWLQAHRDKMPVEMWLGITMDESQRMKPSNVKYITHRWPFCDEMNMRRDDVRRWLVEHGLGVPPRSACVFCPYHSDREWRDLRDVVPDDWRDALTFDAAIRGLRPPYSLFVCNKRMPLVDVQLKGDREELELWENECEGICGV